MKAAKTVKQDKLLKAAVEALEEIKGRDRCHGRAENDCIV